MSTFPCEYGGCYARFEHSDPEEDCTDCDHSDPEEDCTDCDPYWGACSQLIEAGWRPVHLRAFVNPPRGGRSRFLFSRGGWLCPEHAGTGRRDP